MMVPESTSYNDLTPLCYDVVDGYGDAVTTSIKVCNRPSNLFQVRLHT